MKNNYFNNIERKTINNRIMFNLNDIKIYLVSDTDKIRDKVNYYISNFSLSNTYIDLYTFILLIAFSNDYRTFEYKFFLIYSVIDKLNDIIHKDALLDKINTLTYLNPSNNYIFKKNNLDNGITGKSIEEIIKKEIENSFNIDIIRQII